ncbi:MAG: PaaI family thioesterase [Chloroflexota bacterium]|nr:PaaI family thioesterase [Chloroflexota bacterium]MDE3193581.1 PaaI family thioesterase [Chloroflexota bacterium]
MARLSELGVDFQHWCFACGQRNPIGLHLDFDVARGRAATRFTGEKRHEGYEGTLHGGIVAALLDETMGWAIFQSGIWAVTAKLGVTYRRPVPVGDELRVVGEIVRDRGRAIELRGEIARAADGEVLAEADAMYMRMPEETRRVLEQRYSVTPEAFERVRAAVAAEEEAART